MGDFKIVETFHEHFPERGIYAASTSVGKVMPKRHKCRAPAQGVMRESFRRILSRLTGLNRSLLGWYQYFQHSRASTFRAVDGYVRRRLRSLLEKRRGAAARGWGAPINAGRMNGLTTAGCFPWQQNTSGREQS